MTSFLSKPLYDAIRGDKGGGGGSQHTPTEAADTLRSTAYATILDLVSEGEIKGFALGSDKMGQCIALDGTLLESPDGTRNFSNVTVDSRAGTQDQDYIPGVPDVENSLAVGVELKDSVPWVTRITNTNLSAVRIILSVPNGLQKSDQGTGDITGYTVAYKIEMSIDDGVYAPVMSGAFSGKASGKYQRAHRINLPAATGHWDIRVTRTTANANSAMVADRTDVDAEVDILDTKFRYPNSALVSVSIDASQFSSIPTRAYLLEGRIIRIPSNYDPVSRTYTGVWDGTFKPGYTDNPAWAFFDMATHTRYGLGKFLNEAMVDKWKLYTIAQYCDQLVDDGNGGLEPRFTCFLYLQDKADAYKVMQDMATMFRGISYYAGSAIQAVADMPSDPVYAYDDTNVIGGKFTYSGSSRTSRQTVALVSWNDESDFSRAKVEYVEDLEGIARYGVRPTEVTAIGESRRSGAHRAGRHILFTNRLETEMVSFGVGMDGDIAAPGMIVKVTDHSRAGKRQGGRIKSATANVVTVDKAPDVEVGDTLSVNMPDGVLQVRTVSDVAGDSITVGTPFTEAPAAEAVWAVEKTSLAAQLFRVVSVVENSDTDAVPGFTLSCIQHAPEKFAAIDSGIILAPKPITSLSSPRQDPVTNISITQRLVYKQGVVVTVMEVRWDKPVGAVRYEVEWRRDNGQWTKLGNVSEAAVEVNDIYAGTYQVSVTAYNASGVPSVPSISAAVQLDGKTSAPPAPTMHAQGEMFAIALWWDFPTSVNVSDTSYTEVEVDVDASMLSAGPLGKFAYPLNVASITGLGFDETRWVRARLVDKTGNEGAWSAPVSAVTLAEDDLFHDINDATDQLAQDVASLQDQVDGIVAGDIANAKQWVKASTYASGTMVYNSGKLYRAKQAVPADTEITDTAYWEILGDYTSLSSRIDDKADAAAVTALTTRVDTAENGITANATDLTLLGAHNAGKSAFVLNQSTVQIGGGTTFASMLSGLQASDGSLSARIDSEQSARISGDTANATSISSISARMPGGTGALATQASVDSEQSARVSGDSANATSISNVSAKVDNPTTGLAATASVATLAKATADATSGKVNASYTLKVDGGGRVSGFIAQSDGTQSNFSILADNFSIVSPSGGARTEYSAGQWRVYDSSGVLRVKLGVL